MKKYLFLLLCFFYNQTITYKNLVLISAPGSGKGTISQYIVEKYGYIQICPGDILRNEIKKQTPLGKKIESVVQNGEYVNESIVCQLVADAISIAIGQNKPFIIDGFPRTESSFYFLHNYISQHKIHNIEFLQLLADDSICLNRIMGRQVCPECFHVYNIFYAQSNNKVDCDICKTTLNLRPLDTEKNTKGRLHYFHTNIEPLIILVKNFYSFSTIDSTLPINELLTKYDNLIQ